MYLAGPVFEPATPVPALLALHLAVLLFGGAGLFGKLLTLPATVIVLGRVVFATAFLWVVLRAGRIPLRPRRSGDGWGLVALGVLLAVHWVTFFHAIQLSTVAVGLVTFSTFPVFTAFLEPALIQEERWSWGDLAAGVVTLGGVMLVVPSLDWGAEVTRGAFWGVMSGLTFALLSIANRHFVARYPPLVLTLHQVGWAAVALLPVVALSAWLGPAGGGAAGGVGGGNAGGDLFGGVSWSAVDGRDLALLAVLGIVFTAAAHGFFIRGLREVRARVAAVIATLEPVYGIVLALLLLGERPELRTVVGGGVILVAAAWVSLRADGGEHVSHQAP